MHLYTELMETRGLANGNFSVVQVQRTAQSGDGRGNETAARLALPMLSACGFTRGGLWAQACGYRPVTHPLFALPRVSVAWCQARFNRTLWRDVDALAGYIESAFERVRVMRQDEPARKHDSANKDLAANAAFLIVFTVLCLVM